MKTRALPSPAMVVALVALFVALGGTGYAASGALTDGGSPHATVARGRRSSLRGPRGFRGARGATGAAGAQGPAGSAGAQGAAGAPGTAKAYASITSEGTIVPGHAFNITAGNVFRLRAGIFCLNLAGIGITTDNAVAIATPNYRDPSTSDGETAAVNTGVGSRQYNDCPTGHIEVRTGTGSGLNDAGFDIAFM